MNDGQITGADLHLEGPVSQWRGRADASSKASAQLTICGACDHFLLAACLKTLGSGVGK